MNPPDARVTVYDLHGRAVYRGAFSEAELGISVINWPSGLYAAEVWQEGKRLLAKVTVW